MHWEKRKIYFHRKTFLCRHRLRNSLLFAISARNENTERGGWQAWSLNSSNYLPQDGSSKIPLKGQFHCSKHNTILFTKIEQKPAKLSGIVQCLTENLRGDGGKVFTLARVCHL